MGDQLFALPTGVNWDESTPTEYRREYRPSDGNTITGTITFTFTNESSRFLDLSDTWIVVDLTSSSSLVTTQRLCYADACCASLFSDMRHEINGVPVGQCSNPGMQKVMMDKIFTEKSYFENVLKSTDGYGADQSLFVGAGSIGTSVPSTDKTVSNAENPFGATADSGAHIVGSHGVNGDVVYGNGFVIATQIPCGLWRSGYGIPGGQHRIQLTLDGASTSERFFRVFRNSQNYTVASGGTDPLSTLVSASATLTINSISMYISTYKPNTPFNYPPSVIIPVVNLSISSYTTNSTGSQTIQFSVPVSTSKLAFMTNYSSLTDNLFGYTSGYAGKKVTAQDGLRIDYAGMTQPTTQYVTSETYGLVGTGSNANKMPGGLQAYLDYQQYGNNSGKGAAQAAMYWNFSPITVFNFQKSARDDSTQATVRFTRSGTETVTHYLGAFHTGVVMLNYSQNQLVQVSTANASG